MDFVPLHTELQLRRKMKDSVTEEHLYLGFSHQYRDSIFPLHTSISLFLLSYCDCKLFKIFLVPTGEDVDDQFVTENLLGNLEVHVISRSELPLVVQSCCLPAVVVKDGKFCRAGLSVVLRHVIQKTYEADPSKKDLLELLGFKQTCLKACAEVSQWTRLCEISIPLAVEEFLTASPDHCQAIPPAILQLERKLGEPVRVHNDDKIRRQKLQKQKAAVPLLAKAVAEEGRTMEMHKHPIPSLELSIAFSKLLVQEASDAVNREAAHIRRTKTSDLPLLDHVFAEGLYFTIADIVLLPCIHQFLVSCKTQGKKLLNLPLISSWYQRVQEVPGVKTAAAKCNMEFLRLPELMSASEEQLQDFSSVPDELEEENEDSHFIGGPRPTMTKLMENGVEAKFAPHPCPTWTLDWTHLPSAVSPGEGKMSKDRALRKQQQLNNLASAVTKLAKPGDVIVDFCSGGGHVGIVLAHMMPSCQVVLIENKELSLIRAKDRSDELGLNNVWFIQANLDYFNGTFNIGVALHACGVATDMVIEHCIKAQAAFVISPCCYGFIQNTVKFQYPRSHQFKDILSYKEHMTLCRFADQTAVQLPPERKLIGKQCMGLVDLDRAWAAEEQNYSVQVISMEPESCSPKNNMLVGIPT
ncbi:glutathione S-transferase C-terminal domain-containing protein isoform X1 [Melopsittacus undulatus]|uniref:Glutathione S-transferase C-terminal domain-containing protein n=2 Tax=Melopsittacus undulatus TaxID=13146 RepID=A0A8C6IRI6_MELUD|nr:glutathione S-transferase C-terminal domain-containing protein isoform X1 [Melopsittacus undulatus]XP_030904434.2 glutathione S-transferase C-terminal domain-containing protein isoform X1 [Melopsittacus undulatus]XP_030904435.2 glutathione S-transferase C-terminal domain-containing protein isoform X1 [Melopsittacus undulatus]XP_030904436.2 glutathione S-transferase C-terminal domain-containing protein isoform X1 [Melopsittacus undulatus]XP_030904437.2 glutathione S-transferase C-terminal dom